MRLPLCQQLHQWQTSVGQFHPGNFPQSSFGMSSLHLVQDDMYKTHPGGAVLGELGHCCIITWCYLINVLRGYWSLYLETLKAGI